MACTNFSEKRVPFVLQLQIPCGYWYTSGEYTTNPSRFLDFDFLIDNHCVFCVKRCIVESAKLASGDSCEINVDVTSLIGALHYDFMLPNFHTVNPNSASPLATLTSTQSICIEDLVVCHECKSECNDIKNPNATCNGIIYQAVITDSMLFTNNSPGGVQLYADPSHATEATKLTLEAFTLLKGNTESSETNPVPANGCKTIVIGGYISIKK